MTGTVIAIATVNNLKFTKMCVESIERTTKSPHQFLFVDDGSTDGTVDWLKSKGYPALIHPVNLGLPWAVNDMYDVVWKSDPEAFLLIVANDVIVFDGAVDDLIRGMAETDYDVLGHNEINSNEFLAKFPQYGNLFDGPTVRLKSETFDAYRVMETMVDKTFKITSRLPITNCLIQRRSFMDKLGYYDVNYYPQYFCDNDFGYRNKLTGTVKVGTVESAWVYHFWSRSIYEGGMLAINNRYFPLNQQYYIAKWGGTPGNERFSTPFNRGGPINIFDRGYEAAAVDKWHRVGNVY